MQSFVISAHKWHSPDYRRWRDTQRLARYLEVQEEPVTFGQVKVTVGFENSDPDDERRAINEILWRELDDFQLRGTYA